MKKTLIIALLAVLVLGVFTACNGDVNAELAGVENKKTITLGMMYSTYKFEDDTYTKVLEIPSGCNTWKDLAEKGCSIEIKKDASRWTLTLGEKEGNACFKSNPLEKYSFIHENVKVSIPPKAYTDTIENGETYLLNIINVSE